MPPPLPPSPAQSALVSLWPSGCNASGRTAWVRMGHRCIRSRSIQFIRSNWKSRGALAGICFDRRPRRCRRRGIRRGIRRGRRGATHAFESLHGEGAALPRAAAASPAASRTTGAASDGDSDRPAGRRCASWGRTRAPARHTSSAVLATGTGYASSQSGGAPSVLQPAPDRRTVAAAPRLRDHTRLGGGGSAQRRACRRGFPLSSSYIHTELSGPACRAAEFRPRAAAASSGCERGLPSAAAAVARQRSQEPPTGVGGRWLPCRRRAAVCGRRRWCGEGRLELARDTLAARVCAVPFRPSLPFPRTDKSLRCAQVRRRCGLGALR